MNPVASSPAAAGNGFSVLVVAPTSDLVFAVSALSAEGFQVTTAETFEQAKSLLASQAPAVLLTTIRLSEYNGLHLVLRGKAERPDMAAVVTCPAFDPVLLAEADAMNATFVVTPTSSDELVSAVLRTLFRPAGDATLVRPPFERRERERRMLPAVTLADPDRRLNPDRRRAVGTASAVGAWLGQILPESPFR